MLCSRKSPLLYAAVLLAVGIVNSNAQTTNIAIGSAALQPSVKRLGINLSNRDFYDAGQITKNLVMRNPGFEGEIYQSTIRCASGTLNTCLDDDQWSAWPAGFWNGATFQFFYGAAQGQSGTIVGYTPAGGGTGGTFTFSQNGTAPANGDYMIVRLSVPGNPAAGWWPTVGGNGSITANTSDLPPGTTGKQTIAVSAPGASDSVSVASYFDGASGRSFLLLNGTFQLTFKAKATGGSNQLGLSLQRIGFATYLNQTVTLTNSWANYTYTFTAAESGSTLNNVALAFKTVGKDSFYLDDVSLTQVNSNPSNTTAFLDPVVNTLQALQPGSLRFWAGQLGDTLDNLIADQFGRQRAGYLAFYTEQDDISYGLQEFLQLSAAVGAEPWFVVPSTFSTTDASNLIEYLAGSSSTPYGAKRAARGNPEPWTSVFTKIHLEFGNEAWNGSFKGGTIEYPAPYGLEAQAIFGAMRANPSYIPSAFDLVLGGQAVDAGRNQQIQNYVNNNDSLTVAPYMMNTVNSFSDNEDLFGSTFAEPEAYVSTAGVAEGVSGGLMTVNQQAIQSSTHPVPLVMYEINLSTLEGSITQSALNSYVSSLGGGLAVTDAMLLQMTQGVLTQNLWNLTQYNFVRPDGSTVDLWGAVIDMGPTNLRRPQYLALQMVNQAIGSNASMLPTVQTGANPTWNQPLVNTVQLAAAHYLQSYAFSNGSSNSLVVFNLHRTASLPVTFSGSNAPAGNVQITTLTSLNITDTNEASEVVSPVTTTSASFNPAAALNLPPYSMTVLTWTGGISTAPVITGVTATNVTSTSATINWITDQGATSQVEYGPTGYSSLSAANSSLLVSHSVSLTGLTGGTVYNYAVISAGATGQSTTSANFTFTTTTPPPPVIAGVTATSVTSTSATINWTTDQGATSQVEYGPTGYTSLSAANSSLVVSHSVSLTGLTAGTTYNYAVISAGATGQSTTSANFTFTTTTPPPPVITGVTATSVTSTSATINWTTDQGATSQVEYGPTGYSSLSAANSSLVVSHSVSLTGLAAGTTYNYAVISAGATGQSSTSANFTFTTTAPPPPPTGITRIAGTHSNTGGGTAPVSLSIPYSSSSGNTVVATCALGSTSSSISSITDNGSAWALRAFANNGAAVRSEIWSTAAGGSIASKSFTIAISGGTPASCALEEYSGVSGLGPTATSYGVTGTWGVALTTQDPNDYVVAGLGANSYYGYYATAGAIWQQSGLTSNPGSNYVETALCDNTAATATTVSCTSVSSPVAWAAVALELRPGATVSQPPVITKVTASSITTTSATITWTTDQAASSQVQYGTTTGYGTLSANSSSLVTSHSVNLAGLTAGVAYDYAVISSNAAGQSTTSANFTFSTTAPPPPAVIARIGGAHSNTGGSTTQTSLSIPYSSKSGNTVVATCALGSTSASIKSITDTGSTWAFRAFVSNGTFVRSEIWSTTAGGSVASKSFTIAFSSGTPASCALEEYSGVTSLGTTATSQATSGIWSVALTTQDPNDYIVAGLAANSYYGYTATAGAIAQLGGVTGNPGSNYVETALCDNHAAAPASVSCTSVSSPIAWAAVALELR
jgi:alpha-L-arabinofuranosidase